MEVSPALPGGGIVIGGKGMVYYLCRRGGAIVVDKAKYHLSKGFDQKAAEYYASGRRKIAAVVPHDDFTLTLTFDDGERRLYDMKPFLKDGTVFKPLKDKTVFRRVYLDENGAVSWDKDPSVDSSKVWSNKIDLCPDTCYMDSVAL